MRYYSALLKVGLTGGIGCGKSTAIDAFRVLGVPVIDADQISKDLVKPGREALKAICAQFGDDILHQNGLRKGELNRALLKKKVFSDKTALRTLENILHPRIKKEIKKQISLLEGKKDKPVPYIVVDVPLLLEKAYMDMFDRIVVVDCLPDQQVTRVKQRDGTNKNNNKAEALVKKVMETQASREARLTIATDVLDNRSSKEDLLEQINHLHTQFLALT